MICGIPAYLFYSLLAPTSAVLDYLLVREGTIAIQGDKHRSLLHILASMNKRSNNEHIILSLLMKGLSINLQDDDGNTPLHLCCLYGNYTLLPLLIMKGASLTLVNKNNETPMDVTPT